jgi:hypothetical protein
MKILVVPPKVCRQFQITERKNVTESDIVHEIAVFLANSNQALPIGDTIIGFFPDVSNIIAIATEIAQITLLMDIVPSAECIAIATELLTEESYRIQASTLQLSQTTAAHIWQYAKRIKNPYLRLGEL